MKLAASKLVCFEVGEGLFRPNVPQLRGIGVQYKICQRIEGNIWYSFSFQDGPSQTQILLKKGLDEKKNLMKL